MRLRDHLRRETRALHQRTEALLQHLDIRTRAGLDSFLLVHHAVVMPMERRLAASDMTRRWPFRLTDLLVEDLEERALKPTAGCPPPGSRTRIPSASATCWADRGWGPAFCLSAWPAPARRPDI